MSKINEILPAEQEEALRRPINEYVGKIQQQIDALRQDGTAKILELKNHLRATKEDRILTPAEKAEIAARDKEALAAAKEVEAKNKAEVKTLIGQAESYLKEHYDQEVYQPVKSACAAARAEENQAYRERLAALKKEHAATIAQLQKSTGNDRKRELKDEKHVYKSRLFDAKMVHAQALQEIKDRQHECYTHQYHLIDLLRMSKFTFM